MQKFFVILFLSFLFATCVKDNSKTSLSLDTGNTFFSDTGTSPAATHLVIANLIRQIKQMNYGYLFKQKFKFWIANKGVDVIAATQIYRPDWPQVLKVIQGQALKSTLSSNCVEKWEPLLKQPFSIFFWRLVWCLLWYQS